MSLKNNQRGVAHLSLLLLVIVVVGVAGFAAWRIMQQDDEDSSGGSNSQATQEIADACNDQIDDNDLCKFLSGVAGLQGESYRVVTDDAGTGTSTLETDGEKVRLVIESEQLSFETLTIGQDTYTKGGDVWYKHSRDARQPQDGAEEYAEDFVGFEDLPEAETEAENPYRKLGKEACSLSVSSESNGGDLQCFKYQFADSAAGGATVTVWFDDQDYLLRRVVSGTGGNSVELVYSYNDISIPDPSPVRELEANQYLIPGQTQPTTIPSL